MKNSKYLTLLYCFMFNLFSFHSVTSISVLNSRSLNPVLDELSNINIDSSTSDVLNAVTKLGKDSIENGINEVLCAVDTTIKNQKNHLDDILPSMGIDRTTELLMTPFVGIFEVIAGNNLDRKNPMKSLVEIGLEADAKFINSSTKKLYQSVQLFKQLSNVLSTSKKTPERLLSINTVLLDNIYNHFQNFDQLLTEIIQKVIDAGTGIKSVEVSSNAGITIAKLALKLFEIYNAIINKAIHTIQSDIPPTRDLNEILNNLDSIKNSKKITSAADQVISSAKAIIGDDKIVVGDLFQLIKNKKVTKIMEYSRNLVLKMGLDLLIGVNDASKTNALEKITKNMNKIGNTKINEGIVRLTRETSKLWEPTLANELKSEIEVVRKPSPEELLQLALNYCTDVGAQLKTISENDEVIAQNLVDNKTTNENEEVELPKPEDIDNSLPTTKKPHSTAPKPNMPHTMAPIIATQISSTTAKPSSASSIESGYVLRALVLLACLFASV